MFAEFLSIMLGIAATTVHAASGGFGRRFSELVRDPTAARELMQKFSDAQAAVDQTKSIEEIKKLVAALLDENSRRQAQAALEGTPQAAAIVIAALSDTRYRSAVRPPITSMIPSPLAAVITLLGGYGAPDAADAIVPHADHAEAHIRQQVAVALGSICTLPCLPSLQRLLSEEGDYVQKYALIGITQAISAGRGSAEMRAALFDLILSTAGRADGAAECLILLDRPRAHQLLTQPAWLRADNAALPNTLRALRNSNAPMPARHLRALLQTVRNSDDRGRIIGEVLLALGCCREPSDERLIRSFLADPRERVTNDAANALCSHVGAFRPEWRYAADVNPVEDNRVPHAVRQHLAVQELINEVNNGGINQYFFNSYAAHWRDALSGLHAIGATDTAGRFNAVITTFGPSGPSADRDRRIEELASIADAIDALDFDTFFYTDSERREFKLAMFRIANAEQFVGPGTAADQADGS